MSVNRERIERWTKLLVAGDTTELRAVFSPHGARGPTVKWRPTPDDMEQQPLKFTLEQWSEAATGGLPTTRFVDPLALVPALGYLLLVDVVDDGLDFAYRLFGSRISAVSGFDMTRKKLSEHPVSDYIREFSMALYSAVRLRREPVWSSYGPAMATTTTSWDRVILPLVDEAGTVCRFLVAIVPIGLDGAMLRM